MAGTIEPFVRHKGIVAPLDRANVDTDQIIPKQFLKSIKRTGFGVNLFDSWRFLDEGEIGKLDRQENPDFVLNDDRYRNASVLLARENFGCGSSREHAVWALQQYGFRCVIAPSFADIFSNNSLINGFLLITLPSNNVEDLFAHATRADPLQVEIDLDKQTVMYSSDSIFEFSIEEKTKKRLIEGMDDISLTLQHTDDIRTFEAHHRERMPWLFNEAS